MKRQHLDSILERLAARRAVVLVTELATGEARLVDPYGDGGDAGGDAELLQAARAAAERGQCARLERPGGALFLRIYDAPIEVVIVGAVHVAQSLAPMVQLAGYPVTVVDPRRAFATEERFRGVPLVHEWPDEAFARIGIGRRTAVVALTHDPKIDDPAVAAALRAGAFYVGALGSRKTQSGRRERLKAMGFGEEDLARIHGPIGLSIGAVSTGEIAVSILAELVAVLRGRDGA
jgi:xanthine dehydrogenase accessory factor